MNDQSTDPDVPPEDAGYTALSEALQLSFKLLRGLLILLLIGYLLSGVFVVKQDEKAFVLRLGQVSGLGPDRIKGPGLHWTWPRPFTEIVRVPAERVQTVQSDNFWYKRDGGEITDEELMVQPDPVLSPAKHGYALTGDANLLHFRLAVRYTIADPEAWLFGFGENRVQILGQLLDQAAVHTAAHLTVDDIHLKQTLAFRSEIERRLTSAVDELGLGVQVQGVELARLIPPLQTIQAFSEVVKAENDRGKTIAEARSEAVSVANAARGEAEKIRREGIVAKQRAWQEIQADAAIFSHLLTRAKQGDTVTRDTLVQDAVRTSLSQIDNKFLLYPKASGQRELRLLLNSELKRPGKE